MSCREKLEAVGESLSILQEEGFLYELENLQIIHRAVLTVIPGWVRDSPWVWQVQDLMGWQQFLEALEKVSASLSQLQPALVCLRLAKLQAGLRELEEKGEAAEWSADAVEATVAALAELSPGQLESQLQHLSQVLEDVRPPAGFRALATHPAVVARLGNSNFLTFLANLEEAVDDDLLDAEITQQLHFLEDFIHTKDAAAEQPDR